MTANKKLDKGTVVERFAKATENCQWSSIDEMVQAVKKDPELVAEILKGDVNDKMLKIGVRGLVGRIKQEGGAPLYASIKTTDEKGNTTQVYKQEPLFDIEDYKQCIEFHGNAVVHHAKLAAHYARGFKDKTGMQYHLPFDPNSILPD